MAFLAVVGVPIAIGITNNGGLIRLQLRVLLLYGSTHFSSKAQFSVVVLSILGGINHVVDLMLLKAIICFRELLVQ